MVYALLYGVCVSFRYIKYQFQKYNVVLQNHSVYRIRGIIKLKILIPITQSGVLKMFFKNTELYVKMLRFIS